MHLTTAMWPWNRVLVEKRRMVMLGDVASYMKPKRRVSQRVRHCGQV